MAEYWTVLGAVLPIFLIVGAGVVIRRINWLTEEADSSLLRLVVNLLMPAFLLDALLGNPALNDTANVLIAPVIGFAGVAAGLGLAFLAAPLFGVVEAVRRRTFAFSISIYNYGYIPIPLTLLLFDRETLGVLVLHNLGVEIAIWTLCLAVLAGGAGDRGWKGLLNGPIFAVIAGLLLHYTGLHVHLPNFLLTGIHLLGQTAIPLALLLIGATVADNLGEFDPKRGLPAVAGACVLRLVVIAGLFLAFAALLPASRELKQVLVLQAAMPAAVFPLIMAKHYGGHVPTALRVIVWTSLISLLTIPLCIKFGLSWIVE